MVCELYFNLKRKGRKEDKESLSIDVRVRIVRGEDFCSLFYIRGRGSSNAGWQCQRGERECYETVFPFMTFNQKR